jgi:hypothetical protein
MSKIVIPDKANASGHPNAAGTVQKLVNVVQSTWHAQIPGGAAVALVAGFTNPAAAQADRIPELALAAGGTAGAYVLTGTWNGAAQTETITTVAATTVKGNKPFDTITAMTGPDPVNALDIFLGDSYADPPARAFWTGATGGNVSCQLAGETVVKTIVGLPKDRDWPRRIRRIGHDATTITDGYLVW